MRDTNERRRVEWHIARGGFVAYAVDLDNGNTVARVMMREPGCYFASVSSGARETFATPDAAYAWCDAQIALPTPAPTGEGG